MIDAKAYTEVNEIIQIMPQNIQNQIPEDLRKTIAYNMDKEYKFEIEDFEEIDFLEDTKKILSVLYTDYFATEEERQAILAKEKAINLQNEKEKQEKYPINFMENSKSKEQEESRLIVKKETWYVRIFNKLKEMIGC